MLILILCIYFFVYECVKDTAWFLRLSDPPTPPPSVEELEIRQSLKNWRKKLEELERHPEKLEGIFMHATLANNYCNQYKPADRIGKLNNEALSMELLDLCNRTQCLMEGINRNLSEETRRSLVERLHGKQFDPIGWKLR